MTLANPRFAAHRRLLSGLLFILLSAAPPAWSAAAPMDSPPRRFAVRDAHLASQPQGTGRFRIDARFAPLASAGDLREGAGLALIGRLAKAGVGCDINALFRHGFEGN